MKTSKKVLAVLLTIATLIGIFSCATTVFAEDLNEYTDNKAYQENLLTETVETEEEKAEIVCEVPEKRDEYSKTYKRADGSYTSIISQTPLHIYEEGQWNEIVDTFEIQNGEIVSSGASAYSLRTPTVDLPDLDDTIIKDTAISKGISDGDENKNFSNSIEGNIINNDTAHSEILVKLNDAVFEPFKEASVTVTDVNYYSSGYFMGGNVLVKAIKGNWNSETITYNDVYSDNSGIRYENTVIDYYTGTTFTDNPDAKTVYFNITDLFNQWLTGERNNDGFVLTAENEDTQGVFILAGDHTPSNTTFEFNTFCSIDYVDTSCSNDSFEYLTQEIGRAGQASVNTFSRSLSVTRNDISMDGLRMPVSVGFNYSPAITTCLNLYKTILEIAGVEVEVDLPYGQNWCPTYLQYIFGITEGQFQFFTEEGTLVTFNQREETIEETDENGNKTTETEIVFEADETSDRGYTLELIDQADGTSFENLRVTNPNGESLYFNDMGLVTEIHESEPNSDGTYDKISITFDEENPFKIDCITDGIGRIYDFVYDREDGLLSEIKCLTAEGTPIKAGTTNVDLKTTYGYDSKGNLTSVTYPDGETVNYTYESKGNLIKAQNIDGYNIQYTYDTLGKVTDIAEYAGTTRGNTIKLIQLSNRQVKVVDGYNGTETYQFGRDGKLNYTFDEKGNYLKSDYAPAKDENVYSSNDWSISSQNLLKNGSFEENSLIITNLDGARYWSTEFETTALPEQQKENEEIIGYDSKNFGEKAYLISSEDKCTEFVSQTIDVFNSGSYTFSAFVRSEVAGELSLKIKAIDDSGSVQNSDIVKISSTEGWERYSVTYTPENNFEPAEITVQIGFEESKGTYYVDCAQLEGGLGTAEYNLVQNGSFNNSDEYWSNSEIITDLINLTTIKAVKLLGGLPSYNETELEDHISATTQNIKINGKKGEIYSIGGWFKGVFDDNYIYENVPTQYTELAEQLTSSSAQIKVTYSYIDEAQQTVTESFAVDFAPHNHGWQYAVDSFALKGDTESVDVTIIAKNIVGDSFATGIELTLDNNAFSFVEDEEAETSEEPETEAEDNTITGNTTSEECPCEDCEELDCDCRCENEAVCTCIQCKRRSGIEATSEDGKTITTSSFDGEKYMQSAVTYSNDLNNIISETDENNISSGYAYNENGGLTAFTDGADNSTTYQSNAMGYLTLAESNVSDLTDNAVKMAISYVYDGDLLTTVNQGNVQYTYEYDIWGQLEKILVDGETLVWYNYGDETNRTRLKSIVFGSSEETGFTVKYTYDTNGNIVSVEKYRMVEGEKDSITYNYAYDNLGNLDYIKDNGTGHFLDYTDDGIVIKDGQNGPVIYETKDVTPEIEEDETTEGVSTEIDNETPEIVSITQETANGTSYNHKIYESDYSEETGKSTGNEAVSVVVSQDKNNNFTYGKTIGTQTLSDWFGRNEAVTVMTKDPVDTATTDFASISSQYSYVTKNNITTNLISSVTNTITGEEENNVNYTYTYDSNGRITNASTVSSVPNLSGASQYVYDEAGQLIREITGSITYEYSYDSKGNISTRKHYSGETLTKTDTFTYASDTWEDRLTGYNNKTIAYDSIGNPTSYLGATLSWRGRELAGYSKGNKQISYSYDVDGMRYRKVVYENNSLKATYDYVYSDGTLILLTYTANDVSNTARFVYDSWGEPRGFMLNDSATYLYLKNAQGDITGIVDENGAVLLTYSYTAWGKVTYSATSMESMALAVTLSNVNPFTYRGYCYDYDIGMYYLQSRYYDPQICRFINADSTDYLGATGTLISYNLFAYCENDGVNMVDPKGTAAISAILGFVMGAVFGAIGFFLDIIIENINLLKNATKLKEEIKSKLSEKKEKVKLFLDVLLGGVDGAFSTTNKFKILKKIYSLINNIYSFASSGFDVLSLVIELIISYICSKMLITEQVMKKFNYKKVKNNAKSLAKNFKNLSSKKIEQLVKVLKNQIMYYIKNNKKLYKKFITNYSLTKVSSWTSKLPELYKTIKAMGG